MLWHNRTPRSVPQTHGPQTRSTRVSCGERVRALMAFIDWPIRDPSDPSHSALTLPRASATRTAQQLMAAAVGLAPIVVEKTSNNPMVRQYYGKPVVDLPESKTLLQLAVHLCSCTSRDEGNREVPLKNVSMPTPTSPVARAVENAQQ